MKSVLHHVRRHYHEHYRSKFGAWAHIVFIIDGVLVSIIIALLGLGAYFAFYYHPLRDDFKITVLTDPKAKAGEMTTISVRIVNDGKHRLSDVRLETALPSQFVPEDFPESFDAGKGLVELGVLPPKASADFEFRGLLVGPPGSAIAAVRMTAKDETGNEDERLASGRLAWSQDLITADLVLPDAIVGGQTLPFTLDVRNGSKQAFENVIVRAHLPASFKLTAASPPIAAGTQTIGPLAAGSAVSVEYAGRVSATDAAFDAAADVIWIKDASPAGGQGKEIPLATATAHHPSVAANLQFKAQLDSDQPLAPGSDVPVRIRYRNAGSFTLKEARFALPLDASTMEGAAPCTGWCRAAPCTGWCRAAPAWDGSKIPALKELKPGDAGQLDGVIRIKKSFSQYVTNAKAVFAPTATFTIDQPNPFQATVTGEAATAKIIGQAALAAQARYFTLEGDQIGRGPLPPKAGKTTSYWVFLTVSTGTNDLTGGAVEATLPPDVSWTGRSAVSAGDGITYDAAGRKLVWNVGDLPAHAGAISPEADASFEVALTPTQPVMAPTLVLGAVYSGTDAWTGQNVVSSQTGITASLK